MGGVNVDLEVYEIVITRYPDKFVVRFPQDWDKEGFDLPINEMGWTVKAIHHAVFTTVALQEYEQSTYKIGKSIIIMAQRVVLKQGEEK